MLLETIQNSIVDGLTQRWYAFAQPLYVIYGDRLELEGPERSKGIVWDIHQAMIIVGCRLDGWPIEIDSDVFHSVAYDSVSRPEEDQ